MRHFVYLSLFMMLSAPLYADGLLDKIGQGAKNAGNAVASGLKSSGEAISKGADAVEDSLQDTETLFQEEDSPQATRAKLDAMQSNVVTQLLAENELASKTFDASVGYAVFDMRRITVFPLSGGLGRGVAVSKDGTKRSYMMMGTGGVGAAFGIGGFESQFVIMFETPEDFTRFIENGYEAEGDAGVMKGEERTTQAVKFTQGRSFFVLDKKGWRVNANASGTRYWPDEDLNQ